MKKIMLVILIIGCARLIESSSRDIDSYRKFHDDARAEYIKEMLENGLKELDLRSDPDDNKEKQKLRKKRLRKREVDNAKARKALCERAILALDMQELVRRTQKLEDEKDARIKVRYNAELNFRRERAQAERAQVELERVLAELEFRNEIIKASRNFIIGVALAGCTTFFFQYTQAGQNCINSIHGALGWPRKTS